MVQSLRRSKSFRILFNSPELVEEQRSGFHHFLKHGIAEELSKISFLEVKRQNVDIEVFLDANSFQLIAPDDTSRNCVIKMKTYACKLYVQIRIVWKKKSGDILMQTEPEWVLLAHLPMMTKRGHFVINGSPRVIVHQVVRAPGVYFQKFGKVKKDERNKARFYGDIIPRKGVWVRLQISKTGQVEIKLKKSTKVQAEMVERCLAVIEKQELAKARTTQVELSIDEGGKRNVLSTGSQLKHTFNLPFDRTKPNFHMRKLAYAPFAAQREQGSVLLGRAKSSSRARAELIKEHQIDQRSAWINKAFGLLLSCFADSAAPSAGSDQTFENFDTLRCSPGSTSLESVQNKANSEFANFTVDKVSSPQLNKQPKKINQNYCSRSQFMAITGISKPFLEVGALRSRAITSNLRSNQSHGRLLSEAEKAPRAKSAINLLLDYQSKVTDNKRHNGGVQGLQSRTFVVRSRMTNIERARVPQKRPTDRALLGQLSHAPIYGANFRPTGRLAKVSESETRDGSQNGVATTNFSKAKVSHESTLRQSRARKDLSEKFTKAELKGDDRAFTNVYDNLYRVPEMKELEEKMYPKGSSIPIDTEFKRDFSYKHIFATFKAPWRYHLGTVGRHKLNKKFGLALTENQLTSLDVQAARNWLYRLRDGKEIIDDIDHFQNRRVRQSGELIQNQFENGVTRLRKLVRRKLKTPTFESLPFGLLRTQKIVSSASFSRSPVNLSSKALASPFMTSLSLAPRSGANFRPTGRLAKVSESARSSYQGSERRFVFDETCTTGSVVPVSDVRRSEKSSPHFRTSTRFVPETAGFIKLTRAVGQAELGGRMFSDAAPAPSQSKLRALSHAPIYGANFRPTGRLAKVSESKAFCDPCSAKFSNPIKKSSLFSRSNLWKIRESLCFYTIDKVQQISHWQLRINSRRTPFHSFIPRLLLTDRRGLLSKAWSRNLTDLRYNQADRAVGRFLSTKGRFGAAASVDLAQSTRTVGEKHEIFSILCTIERSVNKSVPAAGFAFVNRTHSSLVLVGRAKCTKGQLLIVFSKAEQEIAGTEFRQAPPELSISKPIRCRMVCRSGRKVLPVLGPSSPSRRYARSVLSLLPEQERSACSERRLSSNRAQIIGEVVPKALSLGLFTNEGSLSRGESALSGAEQPTRFAKPISLKRNLSSVNRTFKQASELFSTKPINGALREFFGSNPLSQYMDQTNPLAELTHKRRISSLGIGGVSRESAGMAIRGIHPTHYGRICPIETPEGKNAGLVNSLALYARLNKYGFIETPYYKVIKGQVQEELGFSFYSALKETVDRLHLAPSDLQQSQANMLGVLDRDVNKLKARQRLVDSYGFLSTKTAPMLPLQSNQSKAHAPFTQQPEQGAVLLETRTEQEESKHFRSLSLAPQSGANFRPTGRLAKVSESALREAEQAPRVQLANDFVQSNLGCLVPVRVADTLLDVFKKVTPYEVDCIGISPVQILSVATSLIPFLEHNDANRALMGSNMQRQAVPLMIAERPIVGTGLETLIAAESGQVIQSSISGLVSHVSANKIIIERLFNTGSKIDNNKVQLSTVFSRTFTDRPINTEKLGPLLLSRAERTGTTFRVANRTILPAKRTFAKVKLSFAETKPRKLQYLITARRNESFLSLQWTTPHIWLDSILSACSIQPSTEWATTSAPNLPRTITQSLTSLRALISQRSGNRSKPSVGLGFVKASRALTALPSVINSPTAELLPVNTPKVYRSLVDPPLLGQERLLSEAEQAPRNQKSLPAAGYRAFRTQTLLRKVTWFCVSKSKKSKNRVLVCELSRLYKNRPQQSRHNFSVFGSLSAATPFLLNFVSEQDRDQSIGAVLPLVATQSKYGPEGPRTGSTSRHQRNQDGENHQQNLKFCSNSVAQLAKRESSSISRRLTLPLAHSPAYSASRSKRVIQRSAASNSTLAKVPGTTFRLGFTSRFAETFHPMTLLPFVHSLRSFSRSNQETCLTQKPLVQEGEWVQKGDILTDCSASEKGELAVGKNVMIAYLPWEGYNFEDAIVVSDRLTKEQIYASLHIERYVCEAQDIKEKITNSNEWFTRNLPGVHPKLVSHLDTFGFPKIGTILKEGDILVGKMRYFRNKPTTPYEKLLSDILGDGHFSVSLTSLRVPKGVHEARVISHRVVKTFRSSLESTFTGVSRPAGTPKMVNIFLGEKRSIQIGDKMSGRHGNKGIISTILPKQDMPYLPDGSPIDILLNPLGVPSRMNVGQIFESLLGLASTYLNQNFKITAFDELYGVEASQSLVYLKLYQARLQSGQNWLFQINFPGKTRLIDGRSGECFDQWVTVGRAYMLKLIHMVNEKIHARNTGPYALITQQPLRGRSQKGGQRLGEMEVWALEGYGAAYILQELLTKKSDDFAGRQEIINSLVVRSDKFSSPDNPYRDYSNPDDPYQRFSDPDNPYQVIQETRLVLGHPEIFKTLICELQALCLDVGVYALKKESFQREYLGIVN